MPNFPTFIAVDSTSGQVFAVSNEAGAVYTIENDETLSLWVASGDTGIVGLALDSASHRLYVSSVGKKVYVYNSQNRERLAVIDLPGVPKVLAVDPQSRQVYAAPWGTARQVYQFDGVGNTYRTAAAVGSGDGDGIAVNPATGRVYVSNALDNSISVLRDSCALPEPESHFVGSVEVVADSFASVGGQFRASGHIRLGSFFRVEDSGSAAWVLFDQQRLTGNGRLVLTAAGQRVEFLQGDFSVEGGSGLLAGADNAQILLTRLSGFTTAAPPRFSSIDLTGGTARGQAAINAGSGSFAASGILDFLLQASSAGVQRTGGMSFNQAITFGDGSVLSLTGSNAPLQSDGRLVWSTTLHLNLPENSQAIPVQVALSAAGIQATLSNLRLHVAGGALTLNGVTLGNSGLTVQSANLGRLLH